MPLTSSCRLCRSLSAAGRRVLSIESFGAFQGEHTRQRTSTRAQALPRMQPCTCECVCTSAPASSHTVEAPTLTCTRIRTDHMCPPAHTETYVCKLGHTYLDHSAGTAHAHSSHTRTHAHPVRGERQGIWEVGAHAPSPLSCSVGLGAVDPGSSSGSHRAPATHAVAEASGTFTALGCTPEWHFELLPASAVSCARSTEPERALGEAEPLGAAGPLSQPSSSFSRQVGVHGAAGAPGPLAVLTVGRLQGGGLQAPRSRRAQSDSHRHVCGEGCASR